MRNLESRDWNAVPLLVRGPFCFLYNISLLVVISCFVFFRFFAVLLTVECYPEKNEIWNFLSSSCPQRTRNLDGSVCDLYTSFLSQYSCTSFLYKKLGPSAISFNIGPDFLDLYENTLLENMHCCQCYGIYSGCRNAVYQHIIWWHGDMLLDLCCSRVYFQTFVSQFISCFCIS